MCRKINGPANLSWLAVYMMVFLLSTVHALGSGPYAYSQGSQEVDVDESEDPEIMFDILARLGQSIIQANEMKKIENKKRGLDLGLNRSYSGSQQAKHMMGIAAASGGPGRRRRSQEAYRNKLPY